MSSVIPGIPTELPVAHWYHGGLQEQALFEVCLVELICV